MNGERRGRRDSEIAPTVSPSTGEPPVPRQEGGSKAQGGPFQWSALVPRAQESRNLAPFGGDY